MEQDIGHVLGAWTDLEGGDEFSGWIKGDPHPEVVGFVAQGGKEFIQLKMAEGQVVEEVGVNLFGMLPSTGEPQANSHLGMLEEQGGIGESQTQVDGPENLSDLGRWGAEMVQGSAAPTGKAFATGLAA